jgi:hypothetical protein
VPAVTLTVTGKRAPLTGELLERVERTAARTLPFNHLPYEGEVHRSTSGRSALFAWRPSAAWDATSPLLYRDDGGVAAAAGMPIPPSGSTMAEILEAARRSPKAARAFIQSLRESFALTHLELDTDRVCHWTAITRLHGVFWAETDDLVIVGNRAVLVHLVALDRPFPAYDALGLAMVASVGWFPNELTPYQGVRVMPANGELVVTPDSVTVSSVDSTLEHAPRPDAPLTDEMVDRLAQALIDAVAPLRSLPREISVGVTGGKDSRLVAAALKAGEVPFTAYTGGAPSSPEVIVGAKVAAALDVEHRITRDKAVKPIPLSKRIDETLFFSEGLTAAWSLTERRDVVSGARVGGAGGETLRSGYVKGVADQLPLSESTALERMRFLLARHDALLRRDLAAAKNAMQTEWAEQRLRAFDAHDLLDRLYLEYRTGRWAAAGHSPRTLFAERYLPLSDPGVVRATLAVGSMTRADDSLFEHLLRRLAPELLNIPLASGRFAFEKAQPRPGDEEGYRRREPIAAKVDRRNRLTAWKHDIGNPEIASVLFERIFDPAAEDLWSIVDREVVERTFTSSALYASTLSVWRLASVATLLSNRWLQTPKETPPIQLTDGLPWSELRKRILRRVEVARARLATEKRHSLRARRSLRAVLDQLAEGTQRAIQRLELPDERARQFLEDLPVRIGDEQVPLLHLLEDRNARKRAWRASRNRGTGDADRLPATRRARIVAILDAIARSLLPAVPRAQSDGDGAFTPAARLGSAQGSAQPPATGRRPLAPGRSDR